jgi:GT2 family glycosyltransferase
MLLMPVHTQGGHGLLGMLQVEEQLALQAVTAGSALSDAPLLANGANLAISRKAFLRTGGFLGDRFASGDDVLLMAKLREAGHAVRYLLDPAVVVTAVPVTTWHEWCSQRLRWAGKMRSGALSSGRNAALLGILFPWMLAWFTVQAAALHVGQQALYTWAFIAGAWLAWSLPTIRLSISMARFFTRHARPLRTAATMLLFCVYTPLIAGLSLVVRPYWKGRRI